MIFYNLLIFSYIFTRGFYSFGNLLGLLITFIFFSVYFFKPTLFRIPDIKSTVLLPLTLIVSCLLSLILYGGLYQQAGFLFNTSMYLLTLSFFLSLTYLINTTKFNSLHKHRFKLLITSAILIQIFMILSSPNPKIDVFDQLKYGSEGLLKGQNPYSINFPQIYNYPQDYFPYLPLTAIIVLPFNIILGDPRFTLIAANLLVVFALRQILKKSRSILAHELIPLIYIFHPQMTFMVEQAWIDPLIFATFAAFIYSVMDKKRGVISTLLLGITISLKQTFILLLPFLYLYKKIPRKILFGSVIVLIISVTPFLLWDSTNFIKDAVMNHFERRFWWHNSLTLNSFYFSQLGNNLPSFLFLTIWGISFVAIIRKIKDLSTLVLGISLWFFIFYFFNYQAYMNYYPFVSSMILLGISLHIASSKENNAYR